MSFLLRARGSRRENRQRDVPIHMKSWYRAESEIALELVGAERMLWAGRPRRGIVFRSSDLFMVPFSLLWAGFAFFWEASVIASGAPFFFGLWGIPFVAVGLYIVAGRFFVDSLARDRTFYGVTDERVVIVSGITSRRVTSLSLRTLSDITLSEKADRTGTISFGPIQYLQWRPGGQAWPGGARMAPAFEMIRDARSVCDLIRTAQSETQRVETGAA